MKKLLFLLALPLLAACSATEVKSTEQAPGVNFGAYRTYNFMPGEARNEAEFRRASVGLDEVKQAVAREMERRGYRRAEQPELWVNIGVVNEEKVQTRPGDFRTDAAPYYIGQRTYHWQAGDVPVGTYAVGTVTVDVVDAGRNDLVWQGVTASPLSKDPAKSARRVDEAITELFGRYPVPAR
ncbi:DUF4136 domain-containing protein [Hymenobacter sp. 15J16-1T3B]|uniref:DUF4136 domain-containing protein n=1 Tax=Hymenobacter sp. 15J16-1T3B TaxID=2886941 RepID=UPI001D1093EB|nr:DUF4136 domain-containing protein [Hymenobacter sp. 15J16-1T3B]MCC3160805.1 DUF4136 domain-containing protein [Hymenobacter sp. 15J16-1T3B]